jgi:D-alanine-D-alanine ligase
LKVLVLYSIAPETIEPGRSKCEFDLSDAARGVAGVVADAVLAGVRGEPAEILEAVSLHKPDVVFNVCEAPLGRGDREAHVAALLEWLGVRFTGSGSETLALCRRKDLVKPVLEAAGVPVPRSHGFPCIVKPAREDASVGIHAHSVCGDAAALARARALIDGPVIVEEFLEGREFAVSLWGRTTPDFDSIGELTFSGGLRLVTYASKWDRQSAEFANSPILYGGTIEPALRQAILDAARSAWKAVGARGYIRVDVRLNAAGAPCVLDVNPNPDLSPGAGIRLGVTSAGWEWQRFVGKVIDWAST